MALCSFPPFTFAPFQALNSAALTTRNPRNHCSLSITGSGVFSMASERLAAAHSPRPRPTMSAFDPRISLILALASQTSSLAQRLLVDSMTETSKYAFPRRFQSRNLEEALMSVPDIETVDFVVLSQNDHYEIREVEPYFIAETIMPGDKGFDFNGASRSFNVLAEYLFGKNVAREKMEMTTPVITSRSQRDGEKIDMTTPVITKKMEDQGKWKMSFVLPAKYGANLPLPKDPSIGMKKVPKKLVAVVAFSGYATDDNVNQREFKLRSALKDDRQFQVKEGSLIEVAQYNPPFTLPFTRRNEISLEVEIIPE